MAIFPFSSPVPGSLYSPSWSAAHCPHRGAWLKQGAGRGSVRVSLCHGDLPVPSGGPRKWQLFKSPVTTPPPAKQVSVSSKATGCSESLARVGSRGWNFLTQTGLPVGPLFWRENDGGWPEEGRPNACYGEGVLGKGGQGARHRAKRQSQWGAEGSCGSRESL